MLYVFGKKNCSACSEQKKILNKEKKEFIFYDLDTVDGLAEAAIRGILDKCEKSLPIIIEEE